MNRWSNNARLAEHAVVRYAGVPTIHLKVQADGWMERAVADRARWLARDRSSASPGRLSGRCCRGSAWRFGVLLMLAGGRLLAGGSLAAISFTAGFRRAAVWREAHHAQATRPANRPSLTASDAWWPAAPHATARARKPPGLTGRLRCRRYPLQAATGYRRSPSIQPFRQ
jgi:hypothetical protein